MSQFTSVPISSLSGEDKEYLYKMYADTYKAAGQLLWFNNSSELFNSRYKCLTTIDSQFRVAYVLFQVKSNYNKISLLCHNGTPEGKTLVMEILERLLRAPGTIIEAADAVSWVLRKRGVPIVDTKEKIEQALDIVGSKNDIIAMNHEFDINNKESYQYTRIYTNDTGDTFHSNETMFGVHGCDYTTEECNRSCAPAGGKRKRKRKIKKNNKTFKHHKNIKTARRNHKKNKTHKRAKSLRRHRRK